MSAKELLNHLSMSGHIDKFDSDISNSSSSKKRKRESLYSDASLNVNPYHHNDSNTISGKPTKLNGASKYSGKKPIYFVRP